MPTWAGVLDNDPVLGRGWSRPTPGGEVTRSGAHGPQGDESGGMRGGAVGHRDRLLINLHADVKRARLVQG